jgi:phenylacetyl-CoA:acceptor oxidoreductase subunit 2
MIAQRHWDARAAANFIFGGTGAGLLICSSMSGDPLSVVIGLALIAGGLGAVWLEIGRKLRALHVLFNPFTSWMTRESFAAVALFILGAAFVAQPVYALLIAAALAAAVFLYCQARILQAAKGIPAWRVPQTVPLIAATGLAEGAGLALLLAPSDALLLALTAAVTARFLAWGAYCRAAPGDSLRAAGKALIWVGSAGALALAALAFAWQEAAPLAGLAALAPGWALKFVLVTRAAFKQRFSLPHLPVRGAR